jgi:hypothetical protein
MITKDNLKVNPVIKNTYQTTLIINERVIDISIDPDDVDIEKTIELANKIIGNFKFYEANAKRKIIDEYLENYNKNWRVKEDGDPELDEKTFGEKLTLTSISFMSSTSIDFFYSENGIFGNHSLIAQSLDGESFSYTTMFG